MMLFLSSISTSNVGLVTAVTAFFLCRYQKTVMNQRGNGIYGSNGISLYPHARTRTHHEKYAVYAIHAVTTLFLKEIFGNGIFLMPLLLLPVLLVKGLA